MANTGKMSVDDFINHMSSLQKPSYGVLGGLAGGYQAITGGNAVKDAYGADIANADQYIQSLQNQQTNQPSLDSLYGTDSPYARQMAAEMAAKDAKAGRNSQYGARSAQLAAMLTKDRGQAELQRAQQMSQLLTAQRQAQQQRTQSVIGQQQASGQQLASLFKAASDSGMLGGANGMLNPMLNRAQTELKDLFGWDQPEGNANQYNVGYNPDPSMGYSGEGLNPYTPQSGIDIRNTQLDPYSFSAGPNTGEGMKADSGALMPNWGQSTETTPSNEDNSLDYWDNVGM